MESDYWRDLNAKELMLNVNMMEHRLFNVNPMQSVWIGMFRKNVMDLIAFTVSNHDSVSYDVMLYSMANRDMVIYHAITLEMYYEFVYAPSMNTNQSTDKQFRFLSVVSRDDLSRTKRKSLSLMMHLCGHSGCWLSQYERIVIVDDQREAVWSDVVPLELIQQNTSLLCLAPTQFSFGEGLQRGYRYKLTNTKLERARLIRDGDHAFLNLIHVLRSISHSRGAHRDKLLWRNI